MVLDLNRSYLPDCQIYYWRDKSGREIDFVLPFENGRIDIIECKVNPDYFSIYPVGVFRELYPRGNNICYSLYIGDPYTIRKNGIVVHFTGTFENYPEAAV
ncbi:MAG: hypothetical protein AMS27_17900 [Bacteroides sp. SM23_62_1]|nr:MAG: hypothetical protein AMS27_17900 [Bacteroides sp. SM23_62_1]